MRHCCHCYWLLSVSSWRVGYCLMKLIFSAVGKWFHYSPSCWAWGPPGPVTRDTLSPTRILVLWLDCWMVQVAGQLLLCYEYRCTVGCFFKLAKKGQYKAARINNLHHHVLLKRKQTWRKCHSCVERLSSRTLVLMSTQTLPSRKDVPRIDVSVGAFCVCMCVCFASSSEIHHTDRQTILNGKMWGNEKGTQHPTCGVHDPQKPKVLNTKWKQKNFLLHLSWKRDQLTLVGLHDAL